jgi:hypothetical protein
MQERFGRSLVLPHDVDVVDSEDAKINIETAHEEGQMEGG